MKTDNLKWCVEKVSSDAPNTNDTQAAQRVIEAHGELVRMQEALAWCRGYLQRAGDAAALVTLDGITGDAS